MSTVSFLAKPILITLPDMVDGEDRAIYALQQAGAGIIHIRKPDATQLQWTALLDGLAAMGVDFRGITLHYQENLARRYGCGGVHVRAERVTALRSGVAPSGLCRRSDGHSDPGYGTGDLADLPFRLSCSCHRWEEARYISPMADYILLSPLFDSVSKSGYKSRFTMQEAAFHLLPRFGNKPTVASADGPPATPVLDNIVGLGGISPHNIGTIRQNGFAGAAVLGAVWALRTEGRGTRIDIPATIDRYRILQRKWTAAGGVLQLISDGNLSRARDFLAGGGRWIQLRMKNTEPETITARGLELRTICRPYGAVLVINDNPEIARTVHAHGVHLGKQDMDPEKARRLLGEAAIIGGTANTEDDIRALYRAGVDYVGLGPFRFTTTKKNLSPLLGIEGYERILQGLHRSGVFVPVVAIGGIDIPDIAGLMHTGINGAAVSGALAADEDISGKTRKMLAEIRNNRTGTDKRVGYPEIALPADRDRTASEGSTETDKR